MKNDKYIEIIRIIIILFLFLSGCQTLPSKVDVQLLNIEEKTIKELIKKDLSEDECILYAFRIERFDYNWLGGYLTAFKQEKENYTIDDFFLYLRSNIDKSDWWWDEVFKKVKFNYLYLKEQGYMVF